MIKKLLIAALAIIVLLVGVIVVTAFMLPTDFKVERETTINKPKADIYNYTKMLKNQNEWGPWFKKEPTMKQEFRGTDGEVGFVSYWNGTNKEVGEGEQEIKKLTPNERIDTELRFKRPFESKSDAYLTLESVSENQTKVKWGFTGSMPRPANLFMLVMDMDKEVGKDFGDGLNTLKQIMENK
ncbi:MAG: SRPBCC family protein [Acidobacteria bacterium]|nr:SRPBCC family protein [Acidobacteriota bacterium]